MNRKIAVATLGVALALGGVGSQPNAATPPHFHGGISAPGHMICELRAEYVDHFTKVASEFSRDPRNTTSLVTINVTYNGFSSQAQAAFQHAVNIVSAMLTSSVPITITANWTPLGTGVLGSAGPNNYFRDFTGAPRASTWYGVALANKLAGTDLDPADTDLEANFNSNFSNWYLGTDGNTPSGQYDFVSVVLHEILHGIGFLGFWQYSGGAGTWGLGTGMPTPYDVFLENTAGTNLLTGFANGSTALGTAITTPGGVHYDSPDVLAANSGMRAVIFSPSPWKPGSSMSHFNDDTYMPGNPNSLMTHALGTAEAIHDAGPLGRAVLTSIGWTVASTTTSSNERIFLGLGPYTQGGWMAALKGSGAGFTAGSPAWTRLPWTAYNSAGGGVRVAAGDVDGDGRDEVIVGLNSGGAGWIAVLDDAVNNYALIRWIQVPWPAYNSANGEVWPAAGDIDGDGRAEIVAGLGVGGGGWFAIFDHTGAFLTWRRTAWAAYNAGSDGSTRPAIANLDGAGTSEIILGLGPGSSGWIEVFTGSSGNYTHSAWLQVPWPSYNAANGETHVAAGDLNGDGRADIVAGLGTGGGGWVYVASGATGFPALGWRRTSWGAYNSDPSRGAVFPAVGNVDNDAAAEIVLGLGPYPGNGGWVEILDNGGSSNPSLGWRNPGWAAATSSGVATHPAIGVFR